jgi:hypothetical protein
MARTLAVIAGRICPYPRITGNWLKLSSYLLDTTLILLCYKYYCWSWPAREICRLIWKERWVSSGRTFRRLRTFIS